MSNELKFERNVVILAATTDGLFLIHGNDARTQWIEIGPFFAGMQIQHAVYDPRDGSLWAAVNGHENRVMHSTDLGETWTQAGPAMAVDEIWHVEPGHSSRPGTVFAGVKPAALYRSDNSGADWRPVPGLNEHVTREEWWPGGAGLILHTILLPEGAPGRIYAGISVAGLFRSDDDGITWRPVNEGVKSFAELAGAEGPVTHRGVHRCVHKVALHPNNSEILFQQNHLGAFRSDDGGEHWVSMNQGLPTTFGFPIAAGAGPNPSIFVVPQNEETLRTPGRLSVWRSEDGGSTWIERSSGLPEGEHNVLREALATDRFDPLGVYFGTSKGTIYTSVDGGNQWAEVAKGLPRIQSIEIAYAG